MKQKKEYTKPQFTVIEVDDEICCIVSETRWSDGEDEFQIVEEDPDDDNFWDGWNF